MTPPPHGDSEITLFSEKFNKSACLMGGMDQIDFLKNASPAEVQREGERLLKINKNRKYILLGTSDFLEESTKVENLASLSRVRQGYPPPMIISKN